MSDRYGATNTPEPAAETPGASSAVSFDEHAVRIAERQYFQPGDDDVMGMFRRVAKAVAAAEQPGQEGAWEEAFFALMASKRFCPGGRVLAGAGTEHGNLLNCFPAGTEVITPEGYVPIEEIQPGAEVVTRSGAIRRVERIKARDVTEEMVTVRVHGRAADALRGTANHRVYAARGGADACELIPLGELRVGDALLTQVDRTVREPEPFDLLAAYGHNFDSVREEDGRIRPVTRAIREYNGDFDRPAKAAPFRRVEARPALARLAGLYLAEGCITPTGVKWTVSRREENLTEEIRRLICEVFGLPVRVCPAANQKHGWIDVYCNSALVREFFLENFGRYSHGKRLPLWAMQMPHHLQAALLSGVVAGDAYLGDRLRLVLANKQLIYQLYSLFQRLGIAGVSMLPANGKLSSKPTFSITSSSEEVTEAVRRLVATQQPPERPVISRLGQRLVNGEVANVVTAVERDTEETTVFNFSVEDEHNYVVNYLAVKNCFVQAATEHEPDSMQGIMEVAEKLALVTKVGGGNGVHLGVLREQGARITGSGGSASGPVSFLRQIYAPILRVVRQGGCLHPDALVNTDRGTLRLGELVDPFQWGWQRHALKVATDEGWRDSPEGYNNGLAETLRVTLGNGAEIQGTPNHRLKVLRADGRREWVELAKLQPGDWAIQALDHHTGSDVLLRPLDRCHHNATRIRTPDRLSARVAYLLGCLWGDGYIHQNRVGLAVADGSPMESEAAELFRELFGLESRVERKPGERSSVVVVSSAALVEWLRLNGLTKGRAAKLEVPRAVRQAPRAVLGAFLRGLFEADGTITSGYPILGTASHRLAHDVLALLAGLGIPAKLMRYNPTPGRYSKAGHYRVRVSTALGLERYLERVGVPPGSRFMKLFQVTPDKRRESSWPLPHAEALLSRVFDGMPAGRKGSPSNLTPLRKTLSRYLRGERTLTATGYAALVAEPALAAVMPAFDFDEYYVRVESVVSAGISLTLDLSVDGNHTYIVNGIVSHNTRRGAGMATLDVDHPDIFDFITCKDLEREQAEGKIETFNISVLASHAFMDAVRRDADWNLVSRVDGRVVRTVKAREIFDAIAEHAWATGEPGLIFIDTVNDFNPMRQARGDIKSTNPCVTGDTRVPTQRGLVPIAWLADREFLGAADDRAPLGGEGGPGDRQGATARRMRAFYTGVRDVLRVETEEGYALTVTPEHRLLTPLGYREAQALQPGDEILIQSGEGLWNTGVALPDWTRDYHRELVAKAGSNNWSAFNGRRDLKKQFANLPTTWSEELGVLLGLVVGDGYVREDGFGISFNRRDYEDSARYRQAFAHWFGSGHVQENGASVQLRYQRVPVAFLAGLGLEVAKAAKKRVPELIFDAPREAVVGFLRGLFNADGTVLADLRHRSCSVRLASSSAALLREAQLLLSNFGIFSRIRKVRDSGPRWLPDGAGGLKEYQCSADFELIIDGQNREVFAREIGFISPRKQERLASFSATYKRGPYRQRFTATVSSIRGDGIRDVYDIKQEETASFIANALVTHNCGEIPLYPGEPCDLGAINLAAFVTGRNQGLAGFDLAELERSTQVAVRFLDDVLDVNRFAVEQNRQMSQALRRLGLGVMGLADALIEMGLPYDTEDGRAAVTAILERMRDAAVAASEQLASERGAFPWHDRAEGIPPRRNVAVLTVAPTGTTSMLFGVSSGVEPVFAPFIWRKIGDDFVPLLSPLFERVARERGLFSDELVRRIQVNHGSVVGLGEVPEDVQRVFRCAHDVMPEDHVRMQAAVQNAFDGDGKMAMNSISKTINLPNGATVADVRKAYLLAYDLTCKGITVYRDGSRDLQVLSTSSSTGQAEAVPGRAWGDRLDLPRSLGSVRESVRFPDLSGGGKLYVNVGFVEDEGVRRPVEVFLNTKGLGPELQGHLIGYGRLIGEVLRLGGSVENVEDALMGIQGVGLLQDQGDIVRSLPEAIALGIRRAVRREVAPVSNAPATGHAGNGRGGNGHSQHAAATAGAGPVAEATGLRCPECGSEGLRREEGCYKCDLCGYSKCG
jgi:ribonucleoside-diphosphate reductase alpha chain